MSVTPVVQLLILSTTLMSTCSSQTHSQQRPQDCLSLSLSVPSCLVPSICPLMHPTDMLHTCGEGRMLGPSPDSCLSFLGSFLHLSAPSLPHRGGDGGGGAHILALCVICLLLGPQQHQAAPCAWSPLHAAGSSLKGGSGGAHAWAAQS